MQVAAYAGLRIRGTAGALASFIGFGLPAFILMMVLSALYVTTSELPPVKAIFLALQAIVVALAAYSTDSFGRTSLKHWLHVLLAGIAAGLFLLGFHPIIVIVLAAILGIFVLPRPGKKEDLSITSRPKLPMSFFILLALAITYFVVLYFVRPDLFSLAETMVRVDLFAFGGGYASLPLMFQEVVTSHGWMDSATFINGLALGQVTPGPSSSPQLMLGSLPTGSGRGRCNDSDLYSFIPVRWEYGTVL